jgi:hypothetical protein
MLERNDAGREEEYPVFATILVLPATKEPTYGVMMPPISVREEGNRFYAMVYGGCLWQIAVGSQKLPQKLKHLILSPKRLILPVTGIDQFRPAAEFFKTTSGLISRHIS